MNRKLLRKQFQWQRDNLNYVSLLTLLVAWGLGAGQAGIDSRIVFIVFSLGTIILGIFMIYSKKSEITYEVELSDKRKNNKSNKWTWFLSLLVHAWMGGVLILFGIYFLLIYNSLL